MNSNDTLPPVPAPPDSGDSDELWPSSGPAKGLRVRLPMAIAALVVVALAGAAAGASLKKSPSSTTQAGAVSGAHGTPGVADGGGAGANGAGRFGSGGGVFGTVTKVDGNTITVTQRDGTTATVVVPSGTTITQTVSASLSDVKAGESIVVRGATSNGKITASNITIAPAGSSDAFGGFGGGTHQNGSGTGRDDTTTNSQ